MTTPDPARPFRHLCPEADVRDALTDDDFWRHVTGVDLVPDYDEYDATSWGGVDGAGMGIAVISDHVSPCPLCGEWGACGYDAAGRPMIHAFYDHEED